MIDLRRYILEDSVDDYKKYVEDCSANIFSILAEKDIKYTQLNNDLFHEFGVDVLWLELHNQKMNEWVFVFLYFNPDVPFPIFSRPLSDGLNNLLSVESDPKRKVTFVINTTKETNWYSYQKYLNSMECHSNISLLFFNTETNHLTDEIYISHYIYDDEIRLVNDKTDWISYYLEYYLDPSPKELFKRVENFVYENEDMVTGIDNEGYYSDKRRIISLGLNIHDMYFDGNGHLINVIAMVNQRELKYDEFGLDETDFSTLIRFYVNIDENDKDLAFERDSNGRILIEDVDPDEFLDDSGV